MYFFHNTVNHVIISRFLDQAVHQGLPGLEQKVLLAQASLVVPERLLLAEPVCSGLYRTHYRLA